MRMQSDTPLQQEQQHLLLLQQQGRWKAAQDAQTLSENVRLSICIELGCTAFSISEHLTP